MSLEGKAAQKVEEVVLNAGNTGNVFDMWKDLDSAFLPIDHSESKYRRFATRCMIQGERMIEYLDELICLFRKARRGTIVQYQDEDVKTHLSNGLASEILNEIHGILGPNSERWHESMILFKAKGKLWAFPLLSYQRKP